LGARRCRKGNLKRRGSSFNSDLKKKTNSEKVFREGKGRRKAGKSSTENVLLQKEREGSLDVGGNLQKPNLCGKAGRLRRERSRITSERRKEYLKGEEGRTRGGGKDLIGKRKKKK